MQTILLLQAAASLPLAGLIWCIQLVHYPIFARLDRADFPQTLRWHGQRITWIVAPLMLLELIFAFWLWKLQPDGQSLAGLMLVAGLWLSTGLVQVPLHSRLSRQYCPRSLQWLVLSNWLRTLMWTGRGLLSLWMLA